jgi:hypothetical protein
LYSSKNPARLRARNTGNTTLFKMETTKAAPTSLAGLYLKYAFTFISDLAFCRPSKN